MRKSPRLLVSSEFDANIKENKRFRLIDIAIFWEAGYSKDEISKLLQINRKEVVETIKIVKNHLEKGSLRDLLTNLK